MNIKIKKSTLLLGFVLLTMIGMAAITINVRLTEIAKDATRESNLATNTLTAPSVAGVVSENKSFNRTTDYLSNPGMGWQYMPSSNTSFFPETTSYISRSSISWREVNPSEGQYNWSTIDNEIAAKSAEGKQTSFRIYTMRGEQFGGDQLPNYVKSIGNTMNGKSPNYNSCSYQEKWGEFVNDLIQKYDGNPSVAFIDISGYSNFNEWSYENFTSFEENGLTSPTTTDGFARKRLIDIFLGGSVSDHECEDNNGNVVTKSYDYSGFQQTQLLMPYAGEKKSLTYAMEKSDKVGIRHDCLGSGISGWDDGKRAFTKEEPTNWFNSRWKTAPVVYELCDNDGWSLERATEMLKVSHAIMVHDNPDGSKAYENAGVVNEMMSPVGYRYSLKQAVAPKLVSLTDTFNVTMTWENFGYSPAYKLMGQDFSLRLVLMSESGEDLQYEYNFGASDVSSWLPAEDLFSKSSQDYSISGEVKIDSAIPDGTYKLMTGIYDRSTKKYINIYNQEANEFNQIELGTFKFSRETDLGLGLDEEATTNPIQPFEPPIGCAADFDKNGIVDINDFAEFAAVYKSENACKIQP